MKITYILPHSPEACGLEDKSFPTFNHFSHRYCSIMEELGHETELLYLGRHKRVKKYRKNLIQFPITFGSEFGKEFSLPLLKYLLKLKTDIVHIHGSYQYNILPLLIILYLKRIPIVIQHHGGASNYSKLKVRLYYKVKVLLSNILFKTIDAFLSVNVEEIENLKRAGLREKNKLIYLPVGVDTSIFFPESKKEARKKLNLPQEKKYILFVGRLDKNKGVDYLIKAFDLLKNKYPDTILLIVGGGPELQNLKQLSRELGISDRVKFTGFVNEARNLRTYYNAADICVFPIFTSGLGIVTLEALACKKPVIGTKKLIAGGVLKDGENALLAELRSVESLAENISILLDDPELADKLSENGYNYIINNVEWRKIGEKLVNIYEKLRN